MKLIRTACAFLAVAALSCAALAATPRSDDEIREQMRALPWQPGPATGSLGDKATLRIPADGALLPQGEGTKFLELNGNLPNPGASVIVGGNWWATFGFIDEGYVKDDEAVDPDALMEVLKEHQEIGNEERRKRGLPLMFIDGWYVPPHYDKATHRLEWGTKLHTSTSSEPFVNYTVRILGRSGHESATLVSDPAHLDRDVEEFKALLSSFEFNPGQKYSEFKSGDRVAAYGLGALVVGGAAAVAAKTGFWKAIVGVLAAGWKLIAAGVVVLLAGLGRLFGRNRQS
jgi:uncharacterized membrane-anchored protein